LLSSVISAGCTEAPKVATTPRSSNSNTASQNTDAGSNGVVDAGMAQQMDAATNSTVDGGTTSPADSGSTTGMNDAGATQPADSGTTNPPPVDAGVPSSPDSGTTGPQTGLPILGNGQHDITAVNVESVAARTDGLRRPTDIAFKPGSNELWVVNQGDSTFTVLGVGSTTVNVNNLAARGGANLHFLAKPSALAFGQIDCDGAYCFATSHDSLNDQPGLTGNAPSDFMGPTLWTSDITKFSGSGPYHRGHYDMLHNSPNGKGIAWDEGNAYWLFDAYHQSITRYDFNQHHGPGGSEHTDGEISRWVQGSVSGVNNVPSHLAFDSVSGYLYVADTGNSRIAVLDTFAGMRGSDYNEDYDGIIRNGGGMFYMQAPITTLVTGATHGITQPAGLTLYDSTLFVTDFASGTIYAFDLTGNLLDYLPTGRPGLSGLEFDSSGNLYAADRTREEVIVISP
ncbi:MAG: hypothetical protein VYC39_13920, partial [Myxococcota bacterium]|nr:hypothetical protein [Myxococcota bacterium]